jgi:hypothetical protein
MSEQKGNGRDKLYQWVLLKCTGLSIPYQAVGTSMLYENEM